MSKPPRPFFPRRGFTIIELMLVLGLILFLVTWILSTLARTRAAANSVKCKSNLRQLGIVLMAYANDNRGWMFPVGPDGPDGKPTALGMNVPPNERWPMRVPMFNLRPPDPLPFNPMEYDPHPDDPDKFSAKPFTPAILACPTEPEPLEAHSYVVNQHLADKRITISRRFPGLSTSEVVVAGEKRNNQRDYYMERNEFDRVVEKYQHGIKMGSNYLFFDGHVSTAPPKQVLAGLDPWDVPPPPTTTPTK